MNTEAEATKWENENRGKWVRWESVFNYEAGIKTVTFFMKDKTTQVFKISILTSNK